MCPPPPNKIHIKQAANTLSKRFEVRFAKLLAAELLKASSSSSKGGGRGNNGKRGGRSTSRKVKGVGNNFTAAKDAAPPTDDERRSLARCLECARMEDVTAAVHEIDRRCPGALVLVDGEAIEVDVDALDTWTFCAVERVVAPVAAMRRASRGTPRRGRKNKRRPPAPPPPLLPPSPETSTSDSGGGLSGSVGSGGGDAEDGGGAGRGDGRPCKRTKFVEASSREVSEFDESE